ncbi:NAD-dependent epimerase/dehydratase family protein [Anatilimnocola sp. NA78]|uniref:NAD-dependent epimerase/dehydratase family protein n=1 Tax=Anatilimnocola sp. NA78 TaxID=3415683 RepID=UPI003CE4DE8C
MKLLITGGAGFVASHLVPRLSACADNELVLLDNFNDYYCPETKWQQVRPLLETPNVTLEEGDFSDFDYCRKLFAKHRPTHLIHLGAYPGVPLSVESPEIYVKNNIAGTTALLEAARHNPVERFLFASSSTVYGVGARAPFVEDAPLGIPASPYGVTKRAAELMGLTYHKLHGVPFTALRLFNVYGPRIRSDLALSIFTRTIMAHEPIQLYGDGTIRRDFTHADDICVGIVAALTASNVSGECINLGHNEPIEIRSLIDMIAHAVGTEAVIEQRAPRAGDMPLTCADLTKAGRLLNYEPRVPIERGVNEYVEWARAKHPELVEGRLLTSTG